MSLAEVVTMGSTLVWRARDLPLGLKIVAAAVAGSMLFAALGLAGAIRLRTLAAEQDRAYSTNVQALIYMTEVRSAIGGQQEAVLSYVLADPGPYRRTYRQDIAASDEILNRQLAALAAVDLPDHIQRQRRAVNIDIGVWRRARDTSLAEAANGADRAGVIYTVQRLNTIVAAAKQSADRLMQELVTGVAAGTKRASQASGRTAQLMLVLGLASAAVALASALLVARSLARPLAEVMDVVTRAAGGDLSKKVTFRRKDEIGRMGAALNDTMAILERTFGEIEHRANHDSLTGVGNRALLHRRLLEAEEASTMGQAFGIVLLDLDNFKQVNDRHGHAAGDHVLIVAAQRMTQVVGTAGTVARLGGDEFAVLLEGPAEPGGVVTAEALRRLADVLTEALEQPTVFDGEILTPRISTGLALWKEGQTSEATVRAADAALYAVKASRKGTMSSHQRERLVNLAAALPEAVAEEQFEVLYQPLVDLRTREVIGVEALIRWHHPSFGTVSPLEFIPLAESTGYIAEIGLWVLEQSCRQVRRWHEENPGKKNLYASVNVSPAQLRDPSFVQDVFAVLERTGLAACHLALEVTESAIVDEEAAKVLLSNLRARAVRISIDDFGTGYSSLRYLTSLPIDVVKIDRSLTGQLDGTPEHAVLIDSVLRLGRALNFTVVAEGVETAEQADELELLGCSAGQGYFWAKPLPASSMGERLRAASLSDASG
ncbi:hypothetical protein Kisp01_68630 [Kineosporia sp. NBRC 101677]|nr:hypothetical protein Kisp01_68630 [Kineosporia sp. NBRC 101677]